MNLFVYFISCHLFIHLASSSDMCGAVRYKYSEMNLGERDDVPYSFQSGNVCQKGCCTDSMEQKFVRPALNVYKGISTVRFNRAYREIKAISEQFKMSVERYILHNTRIALQQCGTLHGTNGTRGVEDDIIQQLGHNQTGHDFKRDVLYVYSNITTVFGRSTRPKSEQLRKTVKTFAKEMHDQRKLKGVQCINEVAGDLHRVVKTAWTVKESLNFGRSLFNSIRMWDVSKECLDALIQMNYCPLCDPNNVFEHTRPCTRYCVNVHRGCLAPLLHLSPLLTEWSKQLQFLLADLRDALPRIMGSINHLVHAVLTSEDVESICEHPSTDFEDSSVTTLRLFLSGVSESLVLFEDMFTMLPYQICSQYNSQPGGVESYCWNGTAMSAYNCKLAREGLYYLNPTQIIYADPMLQEQTNRLSEIIKLLYSESGMDQPPTVSMATVEPGEEEVFCWEGDKVIEENTSDKRDHGQDKESSISSLTSPSSTSCPHIISPLLFFLLAVVAS